MEEVWKDVPGYEGDYKISNLGNLKSFKHSKEKYRKFFLTSKGYYFCILSKNNKQKRFKIHQLVAMAFLNHTPCGMKLIIDHIDDDKLNNMVDNLRIITPYENHNKVKNNTKSSKYIGVSFEKQKNKWRARVYSGENKKHIGYFNTEEDAAKAYNDFVCYHLSSSRI